MEIFSRGDILKNIYTKFQEFEKLYKERLKNLDGLNGDCKEYAELLAEFLIRKKYSPSILCLNRGIHYWVEVDGYSIDCRGVFKEREKLIKDFIKFTNKTRISYIKSSITL